MAAIHAAERSVHVPWNDVAIESPPVRTWVRACPAHHQDRPGLLDAVREHVRARHLSRRTEKGYVRWIRRYVLFHGKRHPRDRGAADVTRFLTCLAVERKVSASTQNEALGALLFLYRHVLRLELEGLAEVVRAKRPGRLPVVLTRQEVAALLARLDGVPRIMAFLLYGAGLRLLECAQLRVKDVDFGARQILVRRGKGERDRITMLPGAVRESLARHLDQVRRLHAYDLAHGAGWVALPLALARRYPRAGTELAWQWVFPATPTYVDAETGQRRRHHLHESVLQRAVKRAVREAGLAKHASCHTLRNAST